LLKNVISKFRISINEQIVNTVSTVLSTTHLSKDNYTFIIQSANILNELNEVISMDRPEMQKLTAVRGSARMYKCPISTFDHVRKKSVPIMELLGHN